MKTRTVFFTGLYLLFLVVIVVLADQGRMPGFVAAIYAFPNGDKIGHLILMGLFSVLVNFSLQFRKVKLFSVNFLLGCLIVTGLVFLEEFSQLFFSSRTFSVDDMVFDVVGIWGFPWIVIGLKRLFIKHRG